MFINRIFYEFIAYVKSVDYIKGVFVEITGVAIEILIILILIPIFLRFYQFRKNRQSQMIGAFFLFQVFHKISRMFLSMASIQDTMPILLREMEKNKNFKIYSHNLYGNIENILFVLKSTVFIRGSFSDELQKKSLTDIRHFKKIAQKSLDELDRLISMFITVPKTKDLLFRMRLIVYPIRDLTENLEKAMQQSSKVKVSSAAFDLEKVGLEVTNEMKKVFLKERKIVDSIQKHRRWLSAIYLITILLPSGIVKKLISKISRVSRKIMNYRKNDR